MKITLKPKTRDILILMGGFVLATLIYRVAFTGPFIYDDQAQIVDRAALHQLRPVHDVIFNGLRQIRLWQNLSFALNWVISPGQTWSFKAFNLSLHLVNCLLLFLWLGRLFPKKKSLTLLTTLIFLLHPLQIQSVSYVMGRVSLLQGFFYLLALLLFSKYGLHRHRLALFSVLVASLFAKETCVLIPILLLAYEFSINQKSIDQVRWKSWVPIFATSFLILPIFWILKDPASMYSETTGFTLYPFSFYLFSQIYFGALYLLLFFCPSFQSIIHSFPVFNPIQISMAVFSGILGLASFVLCFTFLKRKPLILFFVTFFWVVYLPTGSLFQMVNPFAEYRLYLCNLPLSLGLAVAVLSFSEWQRKRIPAFFWPALLIILISLATFQNARIWRNSITIYRQGVTNYPQEHTLHNNLALEYLYLNQSNEALASLLLARKYQGTLAPHLARNFYLLAGEFLRNGDYEKAWSIVQILENEPLPHEAYPPQFYEMKEFVSTKLHLNHPLPSNLPQKPSKPL